MRFEVIALQCNVSAESAGKYISLLYSLLLVWWPLLGGKLMQCHTNRGHCCLTAGIKHLFFVYVRIPGCCFVFSFPFPPFRLAEFDGFVWILIWASIYQCSVFHILSANAVATHSIFFSSPIEITPYYVFYEMQIKRIHFIKLQPNHL